MRAKKKKTECVGHFNVLLNKKTNGLNHKETNKLRF